jgi:hypothetical protein
MASQADIKHAVIDISDPAADNKKLFVLKAPTAGQGGGLRLVYAQAVASTSHTSGTAATFALHKYSSVAIGGTPAVNGTIAAAIGGTAAPLVAAVPQAFTLDADYSYLAPGEWLVVDYQEEGAVPATAFPVNLCVGYIQGK